MYDSKDQLTISKITSLLNVLKEVYNNKDRNTKIDLEGLRQKYQLGRIISPVLRKNGIIDGIGEEMKVTHKILNIEPIFLYEKYKEHNYNLNKNSQKKLSKEEKELRILQKKEEVNKLLSCPERKEEIKSFDKINISQEYIPMIENNYHFTNREYFVGIAIKGLLMVSTDSEWVASKAIKIADAIIEELNKTK